MDPRPVHLEGAICDGQTSPMETGAAAAMEPAGAIQLVETPAMAAAAAQPLMEQQWGMVPQQLTVRGGGGRYVL